MVRESHEYYSRRDWSSLFVTPEAPVNVFTHNLLSSPFHLTPTLHNPLAMSSRIITAEDLKAHTTKDSLWLLINGKGKAESSY